MTTPSHAPRLRGILLPAAIALVLCYAIARIPREVHPLDLTFNAMLDHLLHGRFDVDPAIVGREGFAVGGRVVAYWGILPALLRLPFTVLPGWRTLDLTIGSCLVALAGMIAIGSGARARQATRRAAGGRLGARLAASGCSLSRRAARPRPAADRRRRRRLLSPGVRPPLSR